MKILYFSATGNSLYVAKSLVGESGGELLSIPQLVKQEIYQFTDDKIGIVFPLYAWAVPSFVEDFLRKSTFHCDYLFAITTYGIYAGGVASHLLEIGKSSGHSFDYVNKVKMVDNYLLGFNMAKQAKNEPKKHIEKQIATIKADITASKAYVMNASGLENVATRQMVKSAQKKAPKSLGIKGKITVEDTCIQCGICTQVCPVGNITLDPANHSITLSNRCFTCFACLQNCPQNAIHLKHEMDRSRYRNKYVTLQEIVQSNRQ